MTLNEWSKKYDVKVHNYGPYGALSVFVDDIPSEDSRWDLYHLEDYIVSACVSGPQLVLVPKPRHEDARTRYGRY